MRRFIITLSILGLAAVISYLPRSPEAGINRESLKNFPARMGDWFLVSEQQMDGRSMAVLKADDYIMRTYSNSRGETVSLYIGYFRMQNLNHTPRQCLPGAGWILVKASPATLGITDHDNGQIPVNRYLMEKENQKELFQFWYQGRGRLLANEYLTRVYLLWDSVTKNRTDGALIRINSAASHGSDSAILAQTDLVRSFYPILSQYIPD